MKNNSKNEYQEWFKKADEDGQATEIILKESGLYGIACFHAQQMTEKYLKGLLVYYDKNFPKIHDLIEIQELLLNIEPEIKKYDNELDLLNRYYIETRYPGDYPEFTLEEARQAFEAAKKIKEFVLKKTNQ